jgi:hypothetical protein
MAVINRNGNPLSQLYFRTFDRVAAERGDEAANQRAGYSDLVALDGSLGLKADCLGSVMGWSGREGGDQ